MCLKIKIKSKIAVVILVTWLSINFSSIAIAADEKGQFAIRGAGLISCSIFYQEKQTKSEVYLITASWVDGYLTGRNQFSDKNYDSLSFETTELLMSILEKHCKNNPKDLIYPVINSLFEKLKDQRLLAQSEKIEIVAGERKTFLYLATLNRLKQKLVDSGYYQGKISSGYDEQTKKAIKKFQTSIAFQATGFPDQLTLWRLFREKN